MKFVRIRLGSFSYPVFATVFNNCAWDIEIPFDNPVVPDEQTTIAGSFDPSPLSSGGLNKIKKIK